MEELLEELDDDAIAALDNAENPETRYHLRELRQRILQAREQSPVRTETPSAQPQSPD